MNTRDVVLALLVVTIWGTSFTVIRFGLDDMPPMLLAALRYAFVALPAVFLIRPPAIELRYWVLYGLTVGVGQYGCLFYAMHIGMPAGIASIVLQAQAFFTLLFAAAVFRETVSVAQFCGLVLAIAGLLFVYRGSGLAGAEEVPRFALFLALSGAAFWGVSNIVVRKASVRAMAQKRHLDMFSLIIWSSLVPPIPLLLLAFTLDTPQTLAAVFTEFRLAGFLAVAYLAFAATLFGFGVWSHLLSRYPMSRVAPLSLLVPVTGLLTARVVLGESLSMLQWLGCLLVIAGLLLGSFGFSWRLPARSR